MAVSTFYGLELEGRYVRSSLGKGSLVSVSSSLGTLPRMIRFVPPRISPRFKIHSRRRLTCAQLLKKP
jgi:hypothetical protein